MVGSLRVYSLGCGRSSLLVGEVVKKGKTCKASCLGMSSERWREYVGFTALDDSPKLFRTRRGACLERLAEILPVEPDPVNTGVGNESATASLVPVTTVLSPIGFQLTFPAPLSSGVERVNDFLTHARPAAPPVALTVAGSDSGGGAGIQADLKTFAALGVYGCSALTALTAQNTRGVQAVQSIPSTFVALQLDSVLTDFSVRAVKTGMLADVDTLHAVVAGLDRCARLPLVVDPVMVATSGDRLLTSEAEAILRELLLPRAALLTPNLPEAAALLGEAVAFDPANQWRQAERLLALGPRAVLLKGGHSEGSQAQDLLLGADFSEVFSRPRLSTRNTHGSGCTLSAAITAFLARGYSLIDAVEAAKDYVHRALASATDWHLGQGPGPLNHGVQPLSDAQKPFSGPMVRPVSSAYPQGENHS